MVHTGFMKKRKFSRLFKDFPQYSRSPFPHARYHIFPIYSKKAISVSASNVIQPKKQDCKELFLQFFQHGSLSLSFADCLKAFAWVTNVNLAVASTGGSRGGAQGAPTPLILGKKEEMTEGKKANRASKSGPHPLPPPLAQGLDLPLASALVQSSSAVSLTGSDSPMFEMSII